MMRDPFFHADRHLNRLREDEGAMRATRRVFVLKLVSGLIALGLIGAIFVVWRWL